MSVSRDSWWHPHQAMRCVILALMASGGWCKDQMGSCVSVDCYMEKSARKWEIIKAHKILYVKIFFKVLKFLLKFYSTSWLKKMHAVHGQTQPVCVFMYEQVHMCVGICMHVCALCVGPRTPLAIMSLRCHPSVHPFFFVRDWNLLIGLEFIKWVRLAGQWTPEICLLPPPQHWDDKCGPLQPVFFTWLLSVVLWCFLLLGSPFYSLGHLHSPNTARLKARWAYSVLQLGYRLGKDGL